MSQKITKKLIVKNIINLDFNIEKKIHSFIKGCLIYQKKSNFFKLNAYSNVLAEKVIKKINSVVPNLLKREGKFLILNFNKVKQDKSKITKYIYFLSGFFWSCGSIINQNNNCIIEFLFLEDIWFYKNLINIFKKFEIIFNLSKKNEKILLRIKNQLSVANTLLLLNSNNEAFVVFNGSIEKEIKKKNNSIINIQISNELKTIKSNKKTIKAIKNLKKEQYKNVTNIVKIIWNYRIKFPNLNINELTECINDKENLQINKSKVYRALKKAINLSVKE